MIMYEETFPRGNQHQLKVNLTVIATLMLKWSLNEEPPSVDGKSGEPFHMPTKIIVL